MCAPRVPTATAQSSGSGHGSRPPTQEEKGSLLGFDSISEPSPG